jgi:hypothetical protein
MQVLIFGMEHLIFNMCGQSRILTPKFAFSIVRRGRRVFDSQPRKGEFGSPARKRWVCRGDPGVGVSRRHFQGIKNLRIARQRWLSDSRGARFNARPSLPLAHRFRWIRSSREAHSTLPKARPSVFLSLCAEPFSTTEKRGTLTRVPREKRQRRYRLVRFECCCRSCTYKSRKLWIATLAILIR